MLDIPTVHLGNTNIQPIIYKSNKKKFKKVYVAIFVILVIVTGIVSDFIYKDIKRNEQYSQQLIRIEASLGAIIHACSGCLACISDAEAPKDKEEYHYAVLIQSFTDLDLSINTISLLYGRSIYDEGEPLQVFIELLSSKYMSLVNSSKKDCLHHIIDSSKSFLFYFDKYAEGFTVDSLREAARQFAYSLDPQWMDG